LRLENSTQNGNMKKNVLFSPLFLYNLALITHDATKSVNPSICKHYHDQQGEVPKDLLKRFSILKKCRKKFDCLVNEMLFIRDLKPTLNVQSDSICAKVFV